MGEAEEGQGGMIRFAAVVLLLICCQSCVAKQYVRTLPVPDAKVSKMLFAQWILGDEDREGFYPLTICGQCENEAKVQQLFGEICNADFRKRSVTNWDPNYFVVFLTATDKLVCVLECNEDCFMFVEGRKTFWGYAMGHIIHHNGRDKWHWGTLPDFDRRVMRMLETRDSGQFPH